MIFSKRKKAQSLPETLFFKAGQSFFDYQCKFGCTEIKPNTSMVGLVLDARKEYGVADAVSVHHEDGHQLAALSVISSDGGFRVFAQTLPHSGGEKLVPGDVVLWVPRNYNREMGSKTADPRTGWIGEIRAKVAPEISTIDPNFKVICRYD
jgi:hypothetical protein